MQRKVLFPDPEELTMNNIALSRLKRNAFEDIETAKAFVQILNDQRFGRSIESTRRCHIDISHS